MPGAPRMVLVSRKTFTQAKSGWVGQAAHAIQLKRAPGAIPSFLRWSWWLSAPFALAFAALAVPWLRAQSPALALALQRGFALVCHQNPGRSFVLFGAPVAVCARCLGIYFGAAVGLVINTSRRLAMRRLLVAVAFNLADWIAELAGLHGNWTLARCALGLALGASAAMLVIASDDEAKIPTQAHAA
jgi:uncharacterized membrane protein